jgi:HEAT repeat protein
MAISEQTAFTRFLTAILAQNDEQAEALATELQPSDEHLLLDLARSWDCDQRWWAVRALACHGSAEAIPVLVNALGDNDASVRAVAALSLGDLYRACPGAIESTLGQVATLLGDEEGFVRQAAADGLALCGDAAVNLLSALLQVPHGGARARAAYTLRKIATMKAAAVLYTYLNDPNHLVRAYAYEALDEMGLLENLLLAP